MSAITLEQRRITTEEYHLMAEAGILGEDDRVELIDGKLITLSPLGGPHIRCVNRLTSLLYQRIIRADNLDVEVSVQNSVRLGTYNEPEPDLALLRRSESAHSVPGADEVLLLIEVSDTTLRKDRSVKVPLYAAAGIPEVWIVALEEERVEVYRALEDGQYAERRVLTRGETFEAAGLPWLGPIAVDEVLGPPY